jgi:DNA-binding MarR family transcriptional regulator
MKPFVIQTKSLDGWATAGSVIEVATQVIRLYRTEVRRHRPADLSLSQLGALGFLRWNPGASLSEVADYVGLKLPTTSQLVDELVRRGLVQREVDADDRRRVTLRLLPPGATALDQAQALANARLADVLAPLAAEQRAAVEGAMALLLPLLTADVLGERARQDAGATEPAGQGAG